MSATLLWRPVVRQRDFSLPNALKYKICPRYFDHDGSLGSGPRIFDGNDVPYLQGLADGNVEGADALIQAIRKHGEVEVWTEC